VGFGNPTRMNVDGLGCDTTEKLSTLPLLLLLELVIQEDIHTWNYYFAYHEEDH
jgi:hypothetical protein